MSEEGSISRQGAAEMTVHPLQLGIAELQCLLSGNGWFENLKFLQIHTSSLPFHQEHNVPLPLLKINSLKLYSLKVEGRRHLLVNF